MDRTDNTRRTILIGVLLGAVTLALYWPATRCDFVNYDDHQYVVENAHVTSGLSLANTRWALGSGYASNWHPITWLSHMLDCQLFGLNPWGHHLTNVLLHALNAGLVFVLLRQMTGATWRSLLAAALFAFHPLRVESVAWVAERKDVLSSFFGLLALIAYARYAGKSVISNQWSVTSGQGSEASNTQNATRNTPRFVVPSSTFDVRRSMFDVRFSPPALFYLLSLFFFALGLMSKPMLVTLPFVLLLLDYWPLGRLKLPQFKVQSSMFDVRCSDPRAPCAPSTLSHLLIEKLPFLALAAAASVVTFAVQQHKGAMAAVDKLPLGARCGNALISYYRYVGKLFWPRDLAIFYPHPGLWPLAQVLLAGGVILVISGLVFVQRRRSPFLLVGSLWFVGMLVPVVGLVQVGDQAMADRYTYAPAIGIIVALIWGLHGLAKGGRYLQLGLSVAGWAAVVLCLALTRHQLRHWKDSDALFRHALEVTENNYLAHKAIGDLLAKRGQIDEAIRQYQETIRLKPAYAGAYSALGSALGRKGQTDEAIRQFQEAIRLKPDHAGAHNNLGNALNRKGQTDEAIYQFQEAIRLKPDDADVHNNLGMVLQQKGQIDEAIRQFQEVIRLKPDHTNAHNNLGMVLQQKGQIDEAIRQFQEVIHLNPDDAAPHNNLGAALVSIGQTDEAIRQLQEALRLKPDYADAHNNLGNALSRKGQTDEAIRQLQEALRLKPDDANAHNNLGIAFALKGHIEEAIRQFQESLRLKPDYADAKRNLAKALELRSK